MLDEETASEIVCCPLLLSSVKCLVLTEDGNSKKELTKNDRNVVGDYTVLHARRHHVRALVRRRLRCTVCI